MKKLLSVIVPFYNEMEVIKETYKSLTEVLSSTSYNYEIIFVDDGSSDQGVSIVEEIQAKDDKVAFVGLSRNFGHQLAVTAGIDIAKGDALVIIDADLQDPPEVIKDFIVEWEKGSHVVYGVRKERSGEKHSKLITAKYFYRLFNKISDIQIPLDTGDFRLIDKEVADIVRRMPESDRFLRGMVAWAGFKQTPVYYDRDKRHAGETKYPLKKMLKFALDGILSFSNVPLKLATWLGFLVSIISVFGIFYVLGVRFLLDDVVSGWSFLAVIIFFFSGIQLFSLGIIGEYIGRIYRQSKQRPLYIVKSFKDSCYDKSSS